MLAVKLGWVLLPPPLAAFSLTFEVISALSSAMSYLFTCVPNILFLYSKKERGALPPPHTPTIDPGGICFVSFGLLLSLLDLKKNIFFNVYLLLREGDTESEAGSRL